MRTLLRDGVIVTMDANDAVFAGCVVIEDGRIAALLKSDDTAPADRVIDLGPGAADEGGAVVVQRTPEMVANHENSVTGRFLVEALRRDVAELKQSFAEFRKQFE